MTTVLLLIAVWVVAASSIVAVVMVLRAIAGARAAARTHLPFLQGGPDRRQTPERTLADRPPHRMVH
ncbi:hypothetical protein [Patulibacter minatonensis]|uniref:hypothetical protein n=1 Tax=Patulibacter minatonensis TaxID=298163 RepID=UPI00047B9D3C|nr:hypothetical protein [Patulibacter minatonensis]